MIQKHHQNDPKMRPGGGLGASWAKLSKNDVYWAGLGRFWRRPGCLLGGSWAVLGANMAPSRLPKWSQNGPKIYPKIFHFFDASWDRFWDGFWWIWGAKMEPSWHQNEIQTSQGSV